MAVEPQKTPENGWTAGSSGDEIGFVLELAAVAVLAGSFSEHIHTQPCFILGRESLFPDFVRTVREQAVAAVLTKAFSPVLAQFCLVFL